MAMVGEPVQERGGHRRVPGLGERQIAQLIENEHVQTSQTCSNPRRFALRLLRLQCVDQINRRGEAHTLAVTRYLIFPRFDGHFSMIIYSAQLGMNFLWCC